MIVKENMPTTIKGEEMKKEVRQDGERDHLKEDTLHHERKVMSDGRPIEHKAHHPGVMKNLGIIEHYKRKELSEPATFNLFLQSEYLLQEHLHREYLHPGKTPGYANIR